MTDERDPLVPQPVSDWDEAADDVMRRLTEDARYTRLPRMAKDQFLSPDSCAIIVANVREFLKHESVSQGQLARMAGVSASVVNELLAEKYRGDPAPACKKLNAAMEQHLRRITSPDLEGFVMTGVAKEVFALLHYVARGEAQIGVLTAVSGVGKSLALKACMKTDFVNGIYIEANPGCSSPLYFCRAILHCLRTGNWRVNYERGLETEAVYTRADAFNQIVKRLAGTRRLIVVDEAENLDVATLNLLRQILDATGCNAVLAGRPPLNKLILRSVRSESVGGSVRGRIAIERTLTGLYKAPTDGRWLFNVDDVAEVLEKFKVRFTKDAARWLAALANLTAAEDCGALRYAIRLFRLTLRANAKAHEITVDMLKEANLLQREESTAAKYASLIDPILAASRGRERQAATA